MRKSATRNTCGGNPDCHRSKAPLLSDVQGAGPPLQPLSPHSHLSLLGHLGRALARAGSLAPVTSGSPACPVTAKASSIVPVATGYSVCPVPTGASVTLATAVSMPPPHQGRLMCSGTASGTDTCGWPTHRGGAETRVEPQGLCN